MAGEIRSVACEHIEQGRCVSMQTLRGIILNGAASIELLSSETYQPCMKGGKGCQLRGFYDEHQYLAKQNLARRA